MSLADAAADRNSKAHRLSCDPALGCVNANNTASCDDGNGCTSGEKCAVGACGGGVAKVCTDANACTTDSCAKVSGACVFTMDAACPVKTLPYLNEVDCGDATWTPTAAVNGNVWAVDATAAAPGKLTGSCSLNFNNGATYANVATGAATSAFVIDATLAAKVTLAFHSWNGTDAAETDTFYDRRYVEASVDGFKTIAVSQVLLTNVAKGAWVLEAVDLGALAGKKFQVRFRFDSVDSLNNGGTGWFVDEINVYGGPVFAVKAGLPVTEPFMLGRIGTPRAHRLQRHHQAATKIPPFLAASRPGAPPPSSVPDCQRPSTRESGWIFEH